MCEKEKEETSQIFKEMDRDFIIQGLRHSIVEIKRRKQQYISTLEKHHISSELQDKVGNAAESYFTLHRNHSEGIEGVLSKEKVAELEMGIKQCEQDEKVLRRLFEEKYLANDDMNIEELHFYSLEALENDRKRIARDLHDSTVQLLTMLGHKAELCEKLVDLDSNRAKIELQTLRLCLKDSVNELRNTIFNLRPMSIDDLGLVATVERHILLIKQNYDMDILLQVINKEYDCKPVIKLSVYRIIQEACSNIVKHAKATKANVVLKFMNNFIEIVIEDNGIGIENFSKVKLDRKNENKKFSITTKDNILNGFGLSMLYERVYLLFGTLNITSSNRGTKIVVQVPTTFNGEDIYETN